MAQDHVESALAAIPREIRPESIPREVALEWTRQLEAVSYDLALAVMDAERRHGRTETVHAARAALAQLDEQLSWVEHHQREAAEPLLVHWIELARSEAQAVLTLLASLPTSGGTAAIEQQQQHGE